MISAKIFNECKAELKKQIEQTTKGYEVVAKTNDTERRQIIWRVLEKFKAQLKILEQLEERAWSRK